MAGLARLTECFRERRVLVVLDDVDDLEGQLDMLLPPRRYLHPSSLVILTSRNGSLLGQRCDAVSEVELLEGGLAKRLFSAYAFQHGPPPLDLDPLVSEVIACCQGLPLTLQVHIQAAAQSILHACTHLCMC